MSKLVRNERRKFGAAWANNISVGGFITGLVVPAMQNIPYTSAAYWIPASLGGLVCLGMILVGQKFLGGMEE